MLPRRVFFLALASFGLWISGAMAQAVRYEIPLPALPGTQAMACDFHMHTVFSDGSVWPRVRVDEAWRLGLHAIAITDHVEYQPWKDDVKTENLDRSFELAAGPSREHNILLIRGAEITRDTPPGHFNAIFLKEVQPLARLQQVAKGDDAGLLEAFRVAAEQGAFIFWNHPGWKGPELGQWGPIQEELFKRGWLHGIEICNGATYYREAHEYALERNLTLIGTSDIHGPDLNRRTTPEEHRTLTIAFVEERSPEGLRSALLAGKTVVWYQDMLIGRQAILESLFPATVEVLPPHLRTQNRVYFILRNRSAVPVKMERTGKVGPATITIPGEATVLVWVGTNQPKAPLELQYVITNWWIAPDTGLPVVLRIPGAE
ncbi:MAG: Sb-PDE family phosphodiesterase [Thermoguttaceae bacterium]|nr:Sb-PDE family phosphodiesterase [Thermoguttaceae bacterium]MDW8078476.1 Sb-PDE family phosphodiesterase [Thermoguttaceae bacterium]